MPAALMQGLVSFSDGADLSLAEGSMGLLTGWPNLASLVTAQARKQRLLLAGLWFWLLIVAARPSLPRQPLLVLPAIIKMCIWQGLS